VVFLIYNIMRTIQPYDFTVVSMQELIDNKKIIPAIDNKIWSASIFPKSKVLNLLPNLDKDHLVTQLDDVLFSDFIILDKTEQIVLVNNGTGKRLIKCVEIGDFNDSVKRYIQLDKPVDFNVDENKFMNLPNIDHDLINELDVHTDLIHKPSISTDEFFVKKRPDMFETPIKHPHINIPNSNKIPFKNNNKAVIQQIFKWAKEKGIKYIYCINEYRPFVINSQWTTTYVYYTIKGSY